MTSILSHPSKLRENRVADSVITGRPVLDDRHALDSVMHGFIQLVNSYAVVSATTSIITVSSHAARVGDIMQFTNGNLIGRFATIVAVTETTITVASDLSEAPANGNGFKVYRYAFPILDSSGNQIKTNAPVSVTSETIVSVATTSTAVLSANTNRKGGRLTNIDASISIYVSFSSTATTSKPTKLTPGSSIYLSGDGWVYQGAVSAIHADTGTKSLEVLEL